MSAWIYPSYNWYCSDCLMRSAPFDDEDEAQESVDNHNAENHETDTSDDEKYERFKESRYDDQEG